MKYNTELKSAYIINFIDGKDIMQFQALWGIVLLDKKMRFPENHYVFTSNVKCFIDNELVQTINTIYKINFNTTCIIKLPATIGVIDALSNGISPNQLLHFLNNKKMH